MDTLITARQQTKKRNRKITIVALVLAALLIIVWLMRLLIEPTIERSSVTIATVEYGAMENTITASGEVIPEFEAMISSPVTASIKQVLKDVGTHIQPGESVLLLDKDATLSEFEKLKFQLDLKRSTIKRLKLELQKSYNDLKSNNEIKQLRINSLQADVEDAKRLFKAGGGTREAIQQAEMALKVALLEKKQLENELKTKQQTMAVEIHESELTAAIQESDLKALERKLKKADIVAAREGVITWVNKSIGTTVNEGEALVKIADMAGFKIKGSIADAYLNEIKIGMPAIVKVNDESLKGYVSAIQPSVQNGIVLFDITLNAKTHPLLRPNMKVDVYLVTASVNHVLKVANGPAFKSGAVQDVFVVNNGKAVKRTVQTGMSNFDFVELKGNIKAGEQVIISDMNAFENTKQINLK